MSKVTIELPCNVGDKVWTIDRNDFPCETCEHGEEANYDALNCYRLNKNYECPKPIFSIEEHICEGFTVSGSNNKPFISKPGVWGYEGLEIFCGCDDKIYYTYEDAQKALSILEKLSL